MKAKHVSDKLSRREFISILSGLGLTMLIPGCRRRERLAQEALTPKATKSAPGGQAVASPPPARPKENRQIERPADPAAAAALVILNAKVLTCDPAGTTAQALAVKDGLIQAVGDEASIGALIGPDTQVIDAGGKVVSPGFIDPHIHYAVAGLMDSYLLPFIAPKVTDVPSLQKEVARILASKPKGEWLIGYFFSMGGGPLPDRYELDKVSPQHPVWLTQQGGHFGVANSLALQLAEITAQTPNPNGGVIERGANNEPTGVFYNHRAMDVLRRVVPRYTRETILGGMAGLQPAFLAAGVTSMQDNNIRDLDNLALYRTLAEEEKLKMRTTLYYTLEWPKDLDNALKIEGHDMPLSRFAGYKFLIDGTAPTAFCHEKHSGTSWDLSTWDAKTFKQTIRALHETGRQICVHCYGDAAADLTLDAYEEAMNADPRPDPRHRIEHAVITSRTFTQRCKDLGVVVSYNPTFIHLAGDYWPTQFTPSQMERVMVSREWLEAGVQTTIGSDYPSSPWPKPQQTIAGAMWRESPAKKPVGPQHSLTFMEALRAHTIDAAYAGYEEGTKGSLEPGKLADLVMWSRDPTNADPKAIYLFPDMAMTMIGGQIVHQAG